MVVIGFAPECPLSGYWVCEIMRPSTSTVEAVDPVGPAEVVTGPAKLVVVADTVVPLCTNAWVTARPCVSYVVTVADGKDANVGFTNPDPT